MKKVQTKNKTKGLFGIFATLALAIGVGVSLAPREALRTKASEVETYEEVTSNQDDWSGEYLIVSKEDSLALDGSRTTIDAEGNIVSVTITAGKIALDSKYSFEIIKNGANYDIKSDSGKFIYGKNNDANGLDSADIANTVKNAISYDSSGVAIIKSTGTASNYLVYNSAATNGTRFRYYKSTSSGAGKGSGAMHAVSLFKKVEGEVPVTESMELDTDTLSLDIAEAHQLVPSFAPLAANPRISYSITSQSNPAGSVYVSSNGLVTGLREGTAVIEAVTNDGSDLSATVNVTVSANYASNVITPAEAHELESGDDVVVRGKVVTEVQDNGSYAIQVGDRGIMTYLVGDLTVGNDVIISGKMGAYSGMPQVTTPNSIIDLGPSTTTVTPQVITSVAQLTAELSGTLVQIDGMKYKSGTFTVGSATSVNLELGETTVVLRTSATIASAAVTAANSIFSSTGPDDSLDVTTVLGWFSGVQLLFSEQTVLDKITPVFGTLDRIVLNTANVKDSYYVGESFSLEGLVVTAYDEANITKIVTGDATSSLASGYTFVAGDIGSKTITITYVEGVTKDSTFDITVEAAPAGTKVTMSYSGATANMTTGNNADKVGLDDSIFNVTSTEREINKIHIGLNKDGSIRLYGSNNADGNGNVLTVSVSGAYVISSFKISFGGTVAPALIKGGAETLHDGAITKDTSLEFKNRADSEFSIKNIIKNATTNIYILSIEITYESAAPNPIYDEAKVFADWLLDVARNGELCAEKFIVAQDKWDALSAAAKTLFKSDSRLQAAKDRLIQWSLANGVSSLEDLDSNSGEVRTPNVKSNKGLLLTVTILIGVIAVTTLSGIYFIKKRQTQR